MIMKEVTWCGKMLLKRMWSLLNPYKQKDNREYYDRLQRRNEMKAQSAINTAKLDEILKKNGLKGDKK